MTPEQAELAEMILQADLATLDPQQRTMAAGLLAKMAEQEPKGDLRTGLAQYAMVILDYRSPSTSPEKPEPSSPSA